MPLSYVLATLRCPEHARDNAGTRGTRTALKPFTRCKLTTVRLFHGPGELSQMEYKLCEKP